MTHTLYHQFFRYGLPTPHRCYGVSTVLTPTQMYKQWLILFTSKRKGPDNTRARTETRVFSVTRPSATLVTCIKCLYAVWSVPMPPWGHSTLLHNLYTHNTLTFIIIIITHARARCIYRNVSTDVRPPWWNHLSHRFPWIWPGKVTVGLAECTGSCRQLSTRLMSLAGYHE